MPEEIERRFLVKDDLFVRPMEGIFCRQGYICHMPQTVVRVRTMDEKAFLTLKGQNVGYTRAEYDPIPLEDAVELLEKFCPYGILEKMRFYVEYEEKTWTVDIFYGDNDGLILAEIELESEQEAFSKLLWLGEEVTADYRYSGTELSLKPYASW